MAPLSIVLVILSSIIHVSWNYFTKSSSNPRVFSLLKGTILVSLLLVVVPIIPLNSISRNIWTFIILSGIVHAIYALSLASAYEAGDMSFVYPIARSAPAFVPIVAFLILGERISIQGAFGIAVVVLGVFLMQIRGPGNLELRQLLPAFKKKDSLWAFMTLGSVVSYTIVDKVGMVAFSRIGEIANGFHGPVYFLLENSICYILFWLYMFFRRELAIGPVWRTEWRFCVLAAIGTWTSYSLILHVMQIETVSYIVTLRQSSILFAVLTGWKALKESYGRYRLFVAFFMLLGFFLVATG